MKKSTKAERRRRAERRTLAIGFGAVAALLLLASALLMLFGNAAQAPTIGGPFRLTDSNGHSVSSTDFRGRYMLIYFGYTSCPDTCPTTLGDIAVALGRLGPKANRVQPLFITVDPARDTPHVIGSYVSAFTPRLIGLTGSVAEIASVAREYRVVADLHRSGAGYTVDHTAALYLLGPDGRFISAISAEQTGDAMARAIARYVS
jgi:protein SCO1/2